MRHSPLICYEGINRGPDGAVGSDDGHLLQWAMRRRRGLAKGRALRMKQRRVMLLDHVEERRGFGEPVLYRRRRKGLRRLGVVVVQSVELLGNDALDRRPRGGVEARVIAGACGGGRARRPGPAAMVKARMASMSDPFSRY